MASAENQKPACPVCHRSDQVKTTQAAYDSGVAKAAPPDMPTKKVSMLAYMFTGMLIVGICVFLIVVLIGGLEDNFGTVGATILVCVTIVCILAALVLSFVAFQRVVQGDAEATRRYPAWDEAMAVWRSLDYCSRDDVVFDPQTNKVLSNQQLAALRAMDEKGEAAESAMLAHQ